MKPSAGGDASSPCPYKVGRKHFRQDPYPTLASFRAQCPAVSIEANGYRMWLVTRYDDARRILTDPTFCKDIVEHRRRVVPQCALHPEKSAHIPHRSRRSLVDRDGADHRRLRRVVRRVLAKRVLTGHRQAFEDATRALLDQLPCGHPVDLMDAYARPLCMDFIASLYGVPKNEAIEFPAWDNAMLTGASIEEVESGGRKLHEFALRMLDLKRRERREDVFTDLLQESESGAIDTDELVSTYIVLMLGAGEVANAIGSGLLLLSSHPDYYDLMRRYPNRVGACAEEVLRYESPFRLLPPRFSERAVLVDGVTIPEGELIVVSPAAANRDPSRFADPERFDPMRCTRGHLAFGHGAHACPGAQFARMELEVALRQFIGRFERCELMMPSANARWRGGDFMRRLDELVVVLGAGS